MGSRSMAALVLLLLAGWQAHPARGQGVASAVGVIELLEIEAVAPGAVTGSAAPFAPAALPSSRVAAAPVRPATPPIRAIIEGLAPAGFPGAISVWFASPVALLQALLQLVSHPVYRSPPPPPVPPVTRPAARPVRATPGPVLSRRQRIARAARSLAGKRIAYARSTRSGRRGCAQVASTILKRAGVLPKIRLRVVDVVRDLQRRSWRNVRPPPYREGDVITWKTYDRNGDGRKDPDTHIGIIVMQGNTPYVVHNSSRKRRVVKQRLASVRYPVTRVMREGGGA